MKVIYLAHPCGAPTKEQHMANLKRALRWFKWAADQDVSVVADWILYCEIWDDFDHKARAVGLNHDDAMIAKCDEYWMVGGQRTNGVNRGRAIAIGAGVQVRDFTYLGDEPPLPAGKGEKRT